MIRCSTFKLLLLATASVAATGCALKPVESPPTEARDHNCAAPDSLHLVSTSTSKPEVDPEIDSLLAQETQDARLMQINRRMYQSLHALDVELRRQQAIAACKQPSLDGSILEAQSMLGSRPAPSSHAASQNSLAPGATGGAGVTGSAGAASPNAGSSGQISALRKATMSPTGAAGNGATAPKIVPGSDNDIVARRLRKAAEEETDPKLRAKLWKEYMDYRQGTAVAK
jgi:hypothetical protein